VITNTKDKKTAVILQTVNLLVNRDLLIKLRGVCCGMRHVFSANVISQTRRGEAPELSVMIWMGFFSWVETRGDL